MKIRFYHWWIYKLYHKFWSPIFEDKPWLLKEVIRHQQEWIDEREQEIKNRRLNFHIVE